MSEDRLQPYGTDHISRQGEELVVYTPSEYPDWRVSEFRKTVIVFGQENYYVREARRLGKHRFCYTLRPWQHSLHDLPGRIVTYSEDTSRERDTVWRQKRWAGLYEIISSLISPAAGFLPSRLKLRLMHTTGLDPASMTRHSLYIQYLAFPLLAFNIIMVPFLFTEDLLLASVIQVCLLLLCLDALFRTGRLMEGGVIQYGLFEWLIPSTRREIRKEQNRPAAEKPAAPDPNEPPPAIPAGAVLLRETVPDQIWADLNARWIVTPEPVRNWRAARYRKVRIQLEGLPYAITGAGQMADRRYLYTLTPWDEHDHDLPGLAMVYDEDWVRQRESLRREENKIRHIGFGLYLLAPLAGFLPEISKHRLEDRFGLDMRLATRFSLFLQAGLCLSGGFQFAITLFLGGGETSSGWYWALPVLFADCLFRTIWFLDGSHLYGFYEWLWRWFRPRSA